MHPIRKIRLFVKPSLFPGAEVNLEKFQAHYLSAVMRLKVGQEILVFNGHDGEWIAALTQADKRGATLVVTDHTRSQETPPDLWLVFAPIKKARIDFVAQKATELGVTNLIPVNTERTVVSRIKRERLLANAVEAAEQCERLSVPKVSDMVPLSNLLEAWPKGRKLLFCDEEKTGPFILEALKKEDKKPARHPWGVLIGPEGGFSDQERKMIRSHGACVPATLGPRVLRADTAMVSALSLWQAALGDW